MAFANLARLREEIGDLVGAFHWYRKLLQTDPKNVAVQRKAKALLPKIEDRKESIEEDEDTLNIHNFLEFTTQTEHFTILIDNARCHSRRLSPILTDVANILEGEAYPDIGSKLGIYPDDLTIMSHTGPSPRSAPWSWPTSWTFGAGAG